MENSRKTRHEAKPSELKRCRNVRYLSDFSDDQIFYFAIFVDFYEITNVKLFDIQSCQPDRLYFPQYDYDYLLVNKY
jgi:hypothetical protein